MNNEKPEQDLTALWQQQPVSEIDLSDVTRRLKHQQRLQRWYIVSDFTGFLIGLGMLIYSWEKLPLYLALVLCGVMVCGGVFTGFVIWLRRHAVLASFEDTSHYRETLKNQYLSNQRIARITMHSAWSSELILLVIWGIAAVVGDLSWESFVDKGGVTTFIVISVLMAGFGYWAYKREQKFKQEYAQLVSQDQNDLFS
ncbi:MAG: hypothetical protein ACPF9E_10550 [Alteromonas oceani]|tara:strand:- start:150 stop:743 length:594 start_codon:yes stop_codon:yes gene_type:complete